ncbi:MAG: hypothetical protein KDK36_18250 [Leptospiraceae bacterium]|nr:hypothetical protein [Leptospiraceae bacterium]
MIFLIIAFLFFSIFPLRAVAVCGGLECNSVDPNILTGANFLEPVLKEIYTKEFLNSMGESAVLQNINSSSSGGLFTENQKLGLGYSMAKTNLKPKNFLFENTELRELPGNGIAASPSLIYSFNPGKLFSIPLEKLNFSFHYFSYGLSETNIPFLKIKNTNVGGYVQNSGIKFKYFPFLKPDKDKIFHHGFSIGAGYFNTNQKIYLSNYDRRPSQMNGLGVNKNWIGFNNLSYDSKINTINTNVSYYLFYKSFVVTIGGGGFISNGKINIHAKRNSAISSSLIKDDFTTNPSTIYLDLQTSQFINQKIGYAIVGLEYHFQNASVQLEYLRNLNSESLSLNIQYKW